MATKTQTRKKPVSAHDAGKQAAPDNSIRELFHWIADLGTNIPPEELANIPKDASKHLDHYLYGHPKVK